MSDFLENIEPEENATALGQVMAQATRLMELRAQIEDREARLDELKKLEREMSRETVPNLLLQHGLETLGLSNGMTLSVSDELEVAVPKNEDGRRKVIGWLYDHGAGDLVKQELSFEDPDDEIRALLSERGYVFSENTTVNANSLKAWFRGALGIKKASVQRIEVSDVPKEANLFLYKKTTIK